MPNGDAVPRPRSAALSVGWLLLLTAYFRWWDLTSRVPPLALWTGVFLAAFALTLLLVHWPTRWRAGHERGRLILWGLLVVLPLIGTLAVPEVRLRDQAVHTTTFVKLLDMVLPFWIVGRALLVMWSGRARWAALASLPAALALGLWLFTVAMPGRSYAGPPPALTPAESALAVQLERDVRRLTVGPGQRNHQFPALLEGAATFLDSAFAAAGLHARSLPYQAGEQRFRNLEVTIPGTTRPEEIVVIGAHYDAVEGAPGADDNGSGTAALLALARAFAGRRFTRTLKLVAFTNEEPPYFDGPTMGSAVYAAAAAARADHIVAMVSLETIGYYTDEPGSQRYPPPLNLVYPDRGNFIGFVANPASRPLLRRAVAAFRRAARFPSEGAAAPALIPGISWSDHASFWRHGWAAIMITDTAPFRNPHYHLATDTPDRLDYRRMARVVTGLEAVVADLAGE